MDFNEALQKVKKVLIADLASDEGDFDREGTFIHVAREVEGARQFPLRTNSLNIVTFGRGVVISCSPNRLQWATVNLSKYTRDDIFYASVISLMEEYVSRDNQTMIGPDLKYICTPDTFQMVTPIQGTDIKVIEGEETQTLYTDNRFRNALGDKYNPKRPRVLAVAGIYNGEIIGIAAASADSPEMYQIGVDIIPEWRDKRIGSTLVGALTKSVLDREKIPYYSTWANNIAYRRLAIAVGYQPVWVEVYAKDRDEE